MLCFGADILVVVTIASLLLAASSVLLAQKKPEVSSSQDDRVLNYASRGTFIPLGIGTNLYGSIHIWSQVAEPAPSGTPGSFIEWGMHAVGVGPASFLSGIYENGKKLWSGYITPASHPSGTVVDAPGLGSFAVYWGFSTDPVVAALANEANFAVPSQLPLVTKILWQPKILQGKNWGRIEYEMGFPCRASLASAPNEVPALFNDGDGENYRALRWEDIESLVEPYRNLSTQGPGQGIADTDRVIVRAIAIRGDGGPIPGLTAVMPKRSMAIVIVANPNQANSVYQRQPRFDKAINPGDTIKVFGSVAINGPSGPIPFTNLAVLFPPTTVIGVPNWEASGEYLQVEAVEVSTDWIGYNSGTGQWATGSGTPPITAGASPTPSPGWAEVYVGYTKVTVGLRPHWPIPNRITETALSNARVCILRQIESTGINPIAMVSQLLFSSFPYGAGKDRSAFDLASFEEAAFFFARNELVRCNIQCTDGEDAENAVARILQDIGALLTFDPSTGKYAIKIVRNPGIENALDVPASCVVSRPSVSNSRGLQAIDKAMFVFKDRTINYRDQPIAVDDDGNASVNDVQGAQRIELSTVTGLATALLLAKRRSQEILANQSAFEVSFNHAMRLAWPGLSFVSAALPSGGAVLRLLEVGRSTESGVVTGKALLDNYDPPVPQGLVSGDSPPEDAYEDGLSEGLGLRANLALPDTADAGFEVASCPPRLGRGILVMRNRSLETASRVWLSRDGDSFTLAGTEDTLVSFFSLTADLSATATSAPAAPGRLGEASDLTDQEGELRGKQIAYCQGEFFFVEKFDGTALVGLTRGRFSTLATAKSSGAPVFLFSAESLPLIRSLLVRPAAVLHVKVQPIARAIRPLADIEAAVLTLPPAVAAPTAIRLAGFAPRVSGDCVVNWCSSDQGGRTGFGAQGFGSQVEAPPSKFLVQIALDSAPTVVVRSVEVETASFTYTAADRATDLTAGVAWRIRVQEIQDGEYSPAAEKTFL
jgi:hypothetical protein